MDHISALLALAVNGLIHKESIKLLAPPYSQQEAEFVWAAWAPRLSPPPNHPLAAGTLLRDAFMQTMRILYPSAKLAKKACSKLVDDIPKAVLTQTFVTQTTTDLSDEEMEVTLCAPHFDHIWSHSHLPSLSLCGTCFPSSMSLPRRTPIGEACGATSQ